MERQEAELRCPIFNFIFFHQVPADWIRTLDLKIRRQVLCHCAYSRWQMQACLFYAWDWPESDIVIVWLLVKKNPNPHDW